MLVGVFHHIGEHEPDDHFTHTMAEIMAFEGHVTFDGAYREVWNNYTALRQLEPKPIIFVQGDTVGTEGVCTWEQIHKLGEYGFKLGWHGWSHRRLTELSDDEVRRELDAALDTDLYAYPHGDFDERVVNLVKSMGYTAAYSTTQGNDEAYSLRREYV